MALIALKATGVCCSCYQWRDRSNWDQVSWFQLVSTGFSGLILLVFVSICSYLLVFVSICWYLLVFVSWGS